MPFSRQLLCYLGFIVGFSCQTQVNAQNTFNFAVNSPGSPPYIYNVQPKNIYEGLIVDIITKMAKQQKISVNYIDSHRNRTESFIYAGTIDALLSSSQWLAHPEKLISTINIIEHKTYLYSRSPFPENFKISDLIDARVCTRRGYVYGSLVENFEVSRVPRIDSSDQLAMMHMLAKKRCEYSIMHEHTANRILTSEDFANLSIYRSNQPSDITHLAIYLRPELTALKQGLDLAITTMKSDGSFDASLDKHMVFIPFK